jgi:hypothetical protein
LSLQIVKEPEMRVPLPALLGIIRISRWRTLVAHRQESDEG